MQTTTLITVDDSTEAHLLKGRLANEGINCFLTNENFTNLYPGRNYGLLEGIHIMVDVKDLEKARHIIKDKLEPQAAEIECIHCKSRDVVLGSGNALARFFLIMFAFFAAIPTGTPKLKYYCRNCGRKF